MKVKMRDGSEAERKLDRLVQFDPRSRNFPISYVNEGKVPRSYAWRCNTFLDQGTEGSCVGFGNTHELIARPSEVQNLGASYAITIYKDAQKIDPWEGEDYEGTSVLAGVKILHQQGWFESYRWAFGINDLILGVGRNGPAVIGVYWYEGMRDTDSNGYIHVSGSILGGHCLLCSAVNIREKRFTLHNSWGTTWGESGRCYISFSDMERLLREEGEAVFFLHRHSKN